MCTALLAERAPAVAAAVWRQRPARRVAIGICAVLWVLRLHQVGVAPMTSGQRILTLPIARVSLTHDGQ